MTEPHYVYIMTTEQDTVLHTGITGNVKRRAYEHRTGRGGSYTRRFQVTKLVYYEQVPDKRTAEARERRIKAGTRQAKIDLIDGMNPGWRDLYQML
jgi:putative endonuclease